MLTFPFQNIIVFKDMYFYTIWIIKGLCFRKKLFKKWNSTFKVLLAICKIDCLSKLFFSRLKNRIWLQNDI